MLQYAIVILILAVAAAYAVWRIHKALTRGDDPCDGCPGCELKKKNKEKFCHSKK